MSEKIYAWLMKLYPVRFREDFGRSAMQLFRDRLRAERGIRRRFRLWLDIIADLAVSIPREHRRQILDDPGFGGHRLTDEAVTMMTKRLAIAPATFVTVFVLLGFATGWLGDSERPLLFTMYFLLAFRTMGRFGSIRRFKEQWRSYKLILETDRLQQRYRGHDVTVLRRDIVKINEDQHGLVVISLHQPDLRIGRENRPATIWIPAGLNGYRQVREQLLQWIPSDRFMQRRSLWLSDPRPIRSAIWSLLPAMLLIRSAHWFVAVVVVYYGMILLEIMMNVARPPRNSGLQPSRRGLNLPPAAYMWHRFKRQFQTRPQMLALIVLPILRALIATPA